MNTSLLNVNFNEWHDDKDKSNEWFTIISGRVYFWVF